MTDQFNTDSKDSGLTGPNLTDTSNGTFSREVGAKAARKLKARRSHQSVWYGFGVTGLIGWSVVVPTLLGAALGSWMDQQRPSTHSWTLSLLVGGLILGCLNAWQWVAAQDKAMQEQQKDDENE